MAMAKSRRKYDGFSCPNAGQPWHDQLIELKEMANATPSRAIATLLIAEIAEIMQTKCPTKTEQPFDVGIPTHTPRY